MSEISITGHWSISNFPGQPPLIFVSMTLSQNANDLTGKGTFNSRPLSGDLNISGTNNNSKVSLRMTSVTGIEFGFDGTFSDPDTIPGNFSGSGFNFSAPLKRDSD